MYGRHGDINVLTNKQTDIHSRVQHFTSSAELVMGFWNSFLSWLKLKKKEANLLIVGLDNSGKSTIVQHFQSGGRRTDVVPTIGFRVEKIKSICLL